MKGRYESHHKVLIRDEALEAAVSMSERYITDRNLPDKAIDVLDESCSKVSLKGYKVPEKPDGFGSSPERTGKAKRREY